MTAALDLAYLAAACVAWPLYTTLRGWPAMLRDVQRDPVGARYRHYATTIVEQWVLMGIGVWLWLRESRSLEGFGLRTVDGWRLAAAVVLCAVLGAQYGRTVGRLRDRPQARAQVRASVTALLPLAPHTRGHLAVAVALSLTAGVCEEVIFRGLAIGMLAPSIGVLGAAAISAAAFGCAHAYQGRAGIVRTALVGVVFTALVFAFGSLVPAMAVHALVDVGGLTVLWLCQRDLPLTAVAP